MVKQYTSTPRGDIDEPNLNDGTQVKLPPHVTGQIARASRDLITASFAQRPSHELGTLVANQQWV